MAASAAASGSPSGPVSHGRELVESLLIQILEEQRKTNALLALLIQALADVQEGGEQEPATYMNGRPVR